MKNIWLEGIMGLVVGDALGMPVQFVERSTLKESPVETMEGYGTYDMPPGTWSDDSSMALATLDSIRQKGCIDYDDMMQRFMEWNLNGAYTPFGEAFDQGNTCMSAIMKYARQQDYKTCGKTGEYANGNGALMRIMPICIYAYENMKKNMLTLEEAVETVHQVSALTHNHLRSRMACGIYFFMVCNIIDEKGNLHECLQAGVDDAVRFYHKDISNYTELAHYGRLFHLKTFAECEEDKIKSTGYVVDSLEAAVWSLITTDSLENALLKAVNLGDDTDTIGAIVGGLAALFYGYGAIPKTWIERIIRRFWIESLCNWERKERERYTGPVVDVHSHFLPGIDDGSVDMDMSVEMLKMAKEEGVTELFVTPHGDYVCEELAYYNESFQFLKSEADKIGINLYKGCEVFCELSTWEFEEDNDDIKLINEAIREGVYPTYNCTKYVLIEFDIGVQAEEALYMVKRLQSAGYIPVLAHVERYPFLVCRQFVEILVKEGCKVQINAYSLAEEKTELFRNNARYLLENKLVHFIGSDSHRTNHRPPRMKSGVEYIWENCDEEYAKAVIYRNAYKYLLEKMEF